MERVRLIWDFRGPNAQMTAQHHAVHLREFAKAENLKNTLCDMQIMAEMHYIAYLVVEKSLVNELRERLKPHRGQIYGD